MSHLSPGQYTAPQCPACSTGSSFQQFFVLKTQYLKADWKLTTYVFWGWWMWCGRKYTMCAFIVWWRRFIIPIVFLFHTIFIGRFIVYTISTFMIIWAFIVITVILPNQSITLSKTPMPFHCWEFETTISHVSKQFWERDCNRNPSRVSNHWILFACIHTALGDLIKHYSVQYHQYVDNIQFCFTVPELLSSFLGVVFLRAGQSRVLSVLPWNVNF